VTELAIDYTYCDSRAGDYPNNYTSVPSEFISATFPQVSSPQQYTSQIKWSREVVATEEFKYTNSGVWRCHLRFPVPSLKPPLFIYYRLTNFYQNHRSYVKSFNANQLKGVAVSADTLKGGACSPMAITNDNKAIYPCGLIANSIFN
ncbi:4032_t:CDS:2, partial [Dentiscutata heterogama]